MVDRNRQNQKLHPGLIHIGATMPKPDASDNDKSHEAETPPPGILDMLELTPPLRKTYQAILKSTDVSYDEISKLVADEIPEELRIYLNLLTQLGYLEKYSDNGTIRFKLKSIMRNVSTLSDEIWKKLE